MIQPMQSKRSALQFSSVVRAVRKQFRGVKDALAPYRLDSALSLTGRFTAMRPHPERIVTEVGRTMTLAVEVKNISDQVWSGVGRMPLQLRLSWLTNRRQPTDTAPLIVPLRGVVRPGEKTIVMATVSFPEQMGQYLGALQLVQSANDPLAPQGWIDLQLSGREADDIDYYKVFATADLSHDYWTSVGPSTEGEYHKLAWKKLEQLQQIGLKPNSRVLDVGCGTGQLALSLETFLDHRGCYFGTDLGPEAIAYCHTRFQKPNFRFAVNEMTSIPVKDQAFDFITYFSVFTHTYPDETALLLAESARLLAPGGTIVADTFLSRQTDRYIGNRGALEWNETHFHRIAALAGLTASRFDSWKWKTHSERVIWLLRKT